VRGLGSRSRTIGGPQHDAALPSPRQRYAASSSCSRFRQAEWRTPDIDLGGVSAPFRSRKIWLSLSRRHDLVFDRMAIAGPLLSIPSRRERAEMGFVADQAGGCGGGAVRWTHSSGSLLTGTGVKGEVAGLRVAGLLFEADPRPHCGGSTRAGWPVLRRPVRNRRAERFGEAFRQPARRRGRRSSDCWPTQIHAPRGKVAVGEHAGAGIGRCQKSAHAGDPPQFPACLLCVVGRCPPSSTSRPVTHPPRAPAGWGAAAAAAAC